MTRRSRRTRQNDPQIKTEPGESEPPIQIDLTTSPTPSQPKPPSTRTKRRPAAHSPASPVPRKKSRAGGTITPVLPPSMPASPDTKSGPVEHLLDTFHMFRLAPRPRTQAFQAPNLAQGFKRHGLRIRLSEQCLTEELEAALRRKQRKDDERSRLAKRKPTENEIETFPPTPPTKLNRKSHYMKKAADTSKFSALNEHEFDVPTIKLEFPNFGRIIPPKTVDLSYKPKKRDVLEFAFPKSNGPGKNLFQCSRCDYTSSVSSNFNRHHFRLHTPLAKEIKCCDLSFKTRGEFIAHNRFAHPRPTLECSYPECRNRRFNQPALDAHMAQEHHHSRPLQCTDCRYTSDTRANLMRHRSMTHSRSKAGQAFDGALEPEVTLTTPNDNDHGEDAMTSPKIKSEPVDNESSEPDPGTVKIKDEPLDD
ncbi:hypothetical protein TCAL_14589 [Tigriopus californicus]|uniref:C2H2-type domain-containing protein n=1 Tax=Tigriopus californicus TaxID=6832 RepID=A0A553PB34_TIGCA|nr:hypothetical protein TCAL_14589 [Tigriopus californicus]